MWRSVTESIPTAKGLKRRNIQTTEEACLLCNENDESAVHIFTACHVATVVWEGISKWCKIPNIIAFSVKDILGIHKEVTGSERKKEALQGILSIVCWSIWRARSSSKFANTPVRIKNIMSEVKSLGFLWFSSRSKHKEAEWKEWCSFVNM
ncbi:putative reverse transcriptase zinc-binding domain-containing protein [Helianthus annuus]|nr:putative reverse transcriptase zinc-binding domain-containing protein [Helianthus annuus]KAJ0871170.1 putative reverse transcriptase zinc-binding domain-containing protein [Helianthus annuus]